MHPLIDAGEDLGCDHGPLPGGGLPRPCRPRAADEAQRRTDRLAFDQEMARRRAVIGDGSLWATRLGSVTPPG